MARSELLGAGGGGVGRGGGGGDGGEEAGGNEKEFGHLNKLLITFSILRWWQA